MGFRIYIKIITIFIFCIGFFVNSELLKKTEIGHLTTPQIIAKYGFPSETHHVVTEDGYILELHRIPHGKKNTKPTKNFPIFIQHGFEGSSANYVLLGPEDSLAFILAEAGYDVWMGNFRGNVYSRSHVTLNQNDLDFWNFSWHEFGFYDLPAEIDYVCNYTQSEKLIYIGYSMGTTTFFVLTSTRPEYQDKIQEAVLMGAAVYMGHLKSSVKLLAPFLSAVPPVDLILNEQLGEQGLIYRSFAKIVCSGPEPINFCENFLFWLAGTDFRGWPEDKTVDIFYHIPAGTSIKTFLHYAQIVTSGKFTYYDYQLIGNKIRYGKLTPPEYNMGAIRTKIHIFQGANDALATIKDALEIRQNVKSIQRLEIVNDTCFNHFDFILSRDAKFLVYDRLLEVVNEIDTNGANSTQQEN